MIKSTKTLAAATTLCLYCVTSVAHPCLSMYARTRVFLALNRSLASLCRVSSKYFAKVEKESGSDIHVLVEPTNRVD